jgi:hypothetical protein
MVNRFPKAQFDSDRGLAMQLVKDTARAALFANDFLKTPAKRLVTDLVCADQTCGCITGLWVLLGV